MPSPILYRVARWLAAGMTLASAPACALAQTPDPPAAPLSPICTDRPTKANSACTVDAGHFQYEADMVDFSELRLDGQTTDTLFLINPTLKYGLTHDLDLEVSISPFESVRTTQPNDARSYVSGVSDLYIRAKYEFLDVWNGGLQAALLPYVKVPTARTGLGNGAVEEGLYLPVSYKLNSVFSLTTVPEVDYLLDSTGAGRHVNTAQLVGLSASVPHNVTLYAELWGDWNFDPAGLNRQYSADAAVSYAVTPRLQLDAGVNAGLNRYTPAAQVYIGVSQKF